MSYKRFKLTTYCVQDKLMNNLIFYSFYCFVVSIKSFLSVWFFKNNNYIIPIYFNNLTHTKHSMNNSVAYFKVN